MSFWTMPATSIPVVEFDNSGWEDSIIGLQRVMRVLDDEASVILVSAVNELISVMQILVSMGFPPPSIPGEPPHMRTGELQISIGIRNIEPYAVTIEASAPYAIYLEYGTSKMQPRPFWNISLQEFQDNFPQLLVNRIDEVWAR